MNAKYCKQCKEYKVLSEFIGNKHTRDRLQPHCRKCMAQLHRKWVKANPQRVMAYRVSAGGRYDQLKSRSNTRGIKVSILRKDFALWFNSQKRRCYYCNRPLVKYKNGNMQGLTLDRLDNNKPYEFGNIALCCRRCNTMKGSWLTSEQMLDATRRYFPNETSD